VMWVADGGDAVALVNYGREVKVGARKACDCCSRLGLVLVEGLRRGGVSYQGCEPCRFGYTHVLTHTPYPRANNRAGCRGQLAGRAALRGAAGAAADALVLVAVLLQDAGAV